MIEFTYESEFVVGDLVKIDFNSILYPNIMSNKVYEIVAVDFPFIAIIDDVGIKKCIISDMFDIKFTVRMRTLKELLI